MWNATRKSGMQVFFMQIARGSVLQSTLAFLLVGLLALLGIVGMTFWLGERSQDYFDEAIEARDTRGAAVELRNALQTAEASQRGFLFTGNEIYLAPYDAAKSIAQRRLGELQRLLKPYAQYDVVVRRLTAITGQKFDEIDDTVALKRGRRDAEALAAVRTNRGKALMDEANVFFSGVIRAADQRLTQGVAEQTTNAIWLRTFSIIGGIIIVAVVGGAAHSVVRYTRELRAARDEVGVLNAELERRVEARTADLAQANEEIRRFAYIVTHDLRAPLVNIMGFTGEIEGGVKNMQALIERSKLDGDPADPVAEQARLASAEDIPEAINFIRTSAEKMNGLINAIMKLSREGRRTLQPEPFALVDVIQTAAAAIQHQISAADGALRLDIDVAELLSDRLSFEQMMGNLLDNAVKYRSAKRALQIDVRALNLPGDRIEIEVCDNGRGIAERDRARVFEMFARVGVQDQAGEGIGLAYVRTIVRNLGGDIGVTSVPDQGTTFRIVVPRRLQAAEALTA